ncbi:MAG TPA: hypothetical protein VFT67_08540 [Jatrophihabitantaceae bacterium]|nr:hypothetical protein [Jatrophihabitantaceae bacterium]
MEVTPTSAYTKFLTDPFCLIGHNPNGSCRGSRELHGVTKHWRGIVEVAGVTLGVVSFATGIGELAALAAGSLELADALGGVATATAIAAGATDLPACAKKEWVGCISGMIAITAGTAAATKLGGETIHNLAKALGASIGAGTTTLDALMIMINEKLDPGSSDGPSCPRPRGESSWR